MCVIYTILPYHVFHTACKPGVFIYLQPSVDATMLNEQRLFPCRAQNLQTPSHAIPSLVYNVCFGILVVAAKLLLLARKQSVDGRIELVAALEEVQLQDENVLEDLAAELLDERTGCRRGATCCC